MNRSKLGIACLSLISAFSVCSQAATAQSASTSEQGVLLPIMSCIGEPVDAGPVNALFGRLTIMVDASSSESSEKIYHGYVFDDLEKGQPSLIDLGRSDYAIIDILDGKSRVYARLTVPMDKKLGRFSGKSELRVYASGDVFTYECD